MAWTTPITFTTGNVLTAAQMNTYVRDNTNFLFDPPMCRITRAALGTLAVVTGTDTAITGNEEYDTDAMHSNATNPSRITVQTAGVYLYCGSVEWAANATGIRRAHIDESSASETLGIASDSGPTAGALSQQTVAGTFKFAAAGYAQLFGFQTSGGNLNATANCCFSAQWMGSGA